MPVLPLVASMTVWPGLSLPVRSASSITPSARRSLTEPSGLNASILTKRLTPCGASRPIFTTGVLPTVSRMFAKRANLSSHIADGTASDLVCGLSLPHPTVLFA